MITYDQLLRDSLVTYSPLRNSKVMTVLITGSNGQLGVELQRTAPDHYDCLGKGSRELDLCTGQKGLGLEI